MTPREDLSIAEVVALLEGAQGPKLRRLVAELEGDRRTGVTQAIENALSRERARNREQARLKKLYSLEAELRDQGYVMIAGIDEVGRGALAGPLTAGACVLPASPRIKYLNDSKQLTPQRREELAEEIKGIAVCWSVAHVAAEIVDRSGLTAALRMAMTDAIAQLDAPCDHVLLDGLPLRIVEAETAVVGGDGRVASIAAASILAKVTRDGLMTEMASLYPEYGFDLNKGYGTPEHVAAISNHGLCVEHRRSFMPCGGTERLF